jgi:hypothetical protein
MKQGKKRILSVVAATFSFQIVAVTVAVVAHPELQVLVDSLQHGFGSECFF